MEIDVRLHFSGARQYEKVSYPIRYGQLSEITLPDYHFQFNLNGEIKYLQGRGRTWPHPSEWLKRTIGNQWIYYDGSGYNQVFDYLGEYYLPYFTYKSNHLWEVDPFHDPSVQEALSAFRRLPRVLKEVLKNGRWSEEERTFLSKAAAMDESSLSQRAERLNTILGGRVTVLPPDSRHVDYDCVPLNISDGCLYHCAFCRVKTGQNFKSRSAANIREQLRGLKEFLGPDLRNYNSLYLGQHDALNCGEGIIEAALRAREDLELDRSFLEGGCLFLFGSVDSFLRADEPLFRAINRLPFRTFINLGLESADQETLDLLGKPLRAGQVEEVFGRLSEINRQYDRLEVTANFVIDLHLPAGHWDSLSRLTRDFFPHYFDKGAVYLSPLSRAGRRELLARFQEIKRKSRRPVYLYLLQRL
ncbi:MAG: radical SAM protein [Thermodesulfobacteriota bacterium]